VEAKILIVGMDIGGNERADKERFEEAQSRWRRYTVDPKNAHMGGLRLIMKQFAPEVNAALRSRQFAFTNTVKCVTESPSKRTKATDVMIEHCADHLREEICLLEPDLIVTQGEYPAWAVRHKVLMSSQSVGIFRGTPRGVAEVLNGLVGSRRTVVLTTPHPAYALTGFRWRRQEIPHFLEEAFEKARDELVNLLGSRT